MAAKPRGLTLELHAYFYRKNLGFRLIERNVPFTDIPFWLKLGAAWFEAWSSKEGEMRCRKASALGLGFGVGLRVWVWA